MSQFNVVIENVRETRRLLTQFAPDVKKALDKANREAAAPLLAKAKDNFKTAPDVMSGWMKQPSSTSTGGWMDSRGRDLHYDQKTAQRGVKFKQRGRAKGSPWSGVMQLRNETAAGMIYELAGRKNNPTTPQGRVFIQQMNKIWTNKVAGLSRGIWKSAVEYGTKYFTQTVVNNYKEAEKELQRRMDALK